MSGSHYEEQKFEHATLTFVARFYYDDSGSIPWKESDGHGPLSEWTTRSKRPGELVLHEDHSSKRYYDFQAAMRIAKREGWDAEPYKTGTKGEQAYRAVMRDFHYLRDWCLDRWHYCGISVTLATEGGEFDTDREFDHALWGIESNADDYHKEVMRDLAHEALAARSEEWQEEAAEAEERLENQACEVEASRPDMYVNL